MRHRITTRGVWTYSPEATLSLVGMIKAGLLPLDLFDMTTFDLDRINERWRAPPPMAAPLKTTVLQPT